MAKSKVAGPIRTDFVIAFRPLPDEPGGAPAIVRVRQLLKIALRSLRLKCITIAPAVRDYPSKLPPAEEHLDPCRTFTAFAPDSPDEATAAGAVVPEPTNGEARVCPPKP